MEIAEEVSSRKGSTQSRISPSSAGFISCSQRLVLWMLSLVVLHEETSSPQSRCRLSDMSPLSVSELLHPGARTDHSFHPGRAMLTICSLILPFPPRDMFSRMGGWGLSFVLAGCLSAVDGGCNLLLTADYWSVSRAHAHWPRRAEASWGFASQESERSGGGLTH